MSYNGSYTENLDNFDLYEETPKCYLDGRYFNKVLGNYPGLIHVPLNINIFEGEREDGRGNIVKVYENHTSMKEVNVNTEYPGLLRVVISAPGTRHSNLVLIDYDRRKIYRWEPLGRRGPFFDYVNRILKEYFSIFFGTAEIEIIDLDMGIMDQKNPRCTTSGFCNAYIIYYAYCFLNGKSIDTDVNIRKFATLIHKMYGSLPDEGAEVEWGLFGNPNPDQPRNMAIGGLAGLGIGGLVGGVPGAALGGVTGLGIGALI